MTTDIKDITGSADPMGELETIEKMISGELQGPQYCPPGWLFAMRITGTGAIDRSTKEDKAEGKRRVVVRPFNLFASPEAMQRYIGVPVIMDHPDGMPVIKDDAEYQKRIAGAVIRPFIRGNEVWGIVRIRTDEALLAIQKGIDSSSPSMITDSEAIVNDYGIMVEVENNLLAVDHLAIVQNGRWDAVSDGKGIALNVFNDSAETEEPMAEENKPAETEEVKADEAQEETKAPEVAEEAKADACDPKADEAPMVQAAEDAQFAALNQRIAELEAKLAAPAPAVEEAPQADSFEAASPAITPAGEPEVTTTEKPVMLTADEAQELSRLEEEGRAMHEVCADSRVIEAKNYASVSAYLDAQINHFAGKVAAKHPQVSAMADGATTIATKKLVLSSIYKVVADSAAVIRAEMPAMWTGETQLKGGASKATLINFVPALREQHMKE